MGKYLKLCVVGLLCAVLAACAGKQDAVDQTAEMARLQAEAQERQRAEAADRLLDQAHSAIGTPYVRGGTRPGGFDCSGLVLWAYKSVGITLPRTAREQSRVGEHITDVNEMRPGDIVAFRHPRQGYHTGIYVGDGKFIHSPRRRKTVRINRLSDSYFSNTFLGARRVSLEGNEDLVAQAQSRLTDYAEEKAVRELSAPTARKSNKKQASTQRAKKQRKAEARKSGKKRLEARKTEKQRAEARKAKKRRDRQARAERTAKKQPSVSKQKKKADVAHRHNSQKKRKQERS